MGISGLLSFLRSSGFSFAFSESFSSNNHSKDDDLDILAIDGNAMIHNIASHCFDENLLIMKLFDEFDKLILDYSPKHYFIIVIDSSTPLAKAQHSLFRRKKSQNNAKPIRENSIDSLQITPGTNLMSIISKAVHYYALKTLLKSETKKLNVIVCGVDIFGEGEAKIQQILISLSHFHLQRKMKMLFFTPDSDSLLCSLLLSNHFWNEQSLHIILSINSTFVDVFEISTKYFKHISCSKNTDKLILDFVFICILVGGNDYLGGDGSLESGFGKAWNENYLKLKTNSTHFEDSFLIDLKWEKCEQQNNGQIEKPKITFNLSFLIEFLMHDISKTHKISTTTSSMEKKNKMDDELTKKCSLYLYGLRWSLETYLTGKTSDLDFYYRYKFAPTSEQLIEYLLNENNIQFINNTSNESPISGLKFSEQSFLTPSEYGLLVLPQIAYEYLENETLRSVQIDEELVEEKKGNGDENETKVLININTMLSFPVSLLERKLTQLRDLQRTNKQIQNALKETINSISETTIYSISKEGDEGKLINLNSIETPLGMPKLESKNKSIVRKSLSQFKNDVKVVGKRKFSEINK